RGTVTGDERELREGLDVMYECRPSAEPAFREPGRLAGGSRCAILDPVHDSAGFTGDEPVRGGHDLDPDPLRAGPAALGCGSVHDLTDRVMHDNHHLASANYPGCEDRPVQHQLWRPGEQDLILGARGLALGAVRHNDRGVPRRYCRQLPRGWESCTATAGEPRTIHLPDQGLPAPRVRACWPDRAIPGQVLRQAEGFAPDVCWQQARQLIGGQPGVALVAVGASHHGCVLARAVTLS